MVTFVAACVSWLTTFSMAGEKIPPCSSPDAVRLGFRSSKGSWVVTGEVLLMLPRSSLLRGSNAGGLFRRPPFGLLSKKPRFSVAGAF